MIISGVLNGFLNRFKDSQLTLQTGHTKEIYLSPGDTQKRLTFFIHVFSAFTECAESFDFRDKISYFRKS